MADIISGTEMRTAILDELRQEVAAMREKHGTVPGFPRWNILYLYMMNII